MTDLGRARKNTKAGVDRATTAGQASEPAPHSEDDFMTRIQLALDMTPLQLAKALGVDWREVVDRYGPRAAMSSYVADPFWPKLHNYVDQRIAGLLAVQDELSRKGRVDLREAVERDRAIRTR